MLIKLIIESFKISKLESERFFRLPFMLLIALQVALDYFIKNYLPDTDLLKLWESPLTEFNTDIIWNFLSLTLVFFISILISVLYSTVLVKEIRLKRNGADIFKQLNPNVIMMPLRERSNEELEYLQKLLKFLQATPDERSNAKIVKKLQGHKSSTAEPLSNLDKNQQRHLFLSSVKSLLKNTLPILFFLISVLFAMFISAPLMFIIGFIYLFTFCFVPIMLTVEHKSLAEAWRGSRRVTQGNRLRIFIIVILQASLILNFSYLFGAFITDYYATSVLSGLFLALQTLARGRLFGLLYLLIVERKPVIPN